MDGAAAAGPSGATANAAEGGGPSGAKDALPGADKQGAGAAKAAAEKKPDGERKEGAAPKEGAEAVTKSEAAEKRRHKLKVDNEEIEVDDDELKRGYTHSRAANKRMEEAAVQNRQVQAFIEQFSEDPIGVMERMAAAKHLKVDPIKAMEERLAKHYQRSLMTEEQLAAEKRDQEAAAYRQWQESQKTAAAEAEQKAAEEHFKKDYDVKITTVLNASGLPKTTDTVRRVAKLMEIAITKGYEPDLNMIVDIVKKNYYGDTRALYAGMTGQQLIETFGEEIAGKIRKADLERYRATSKQAAAPKAEPKERAPRDKVRMNTREFLEAGYKRAGIK